MGKTKGTTGKHIAKDKTGKWYGDLEVLSRNGSTERGDPLWHCICHRCGAEVDIVGSHLKEKKDCGCRYKEKRADLSGKTFGAVTVLERVGTDDNGNALYLCHCNICGQEKELPATTIRRNPLSCGCQQYNIDKMKELSIKANAKTIVNGSRVSGVFSVKATSRSSTGVRGIFKVKGKFRASVQVAKERATQDFDTIEEATDFREKTRKQLIEKHGLGEYKDKTNE